MASLLPHAAWLQIKNGEPDFEFFDRYKFVIAADPSIAETDAETQLSRRVVIAPSRASITTVLE